MNAVKNRYRYALTDRIGTILADPLGESDFVISWQREDNGEQDYNNTFPSKVEFTGDAFHRLLKIEGSIYRCDYVDLSIERKCGNSTWVPWFSGRMSNNDGEWDLDRCTVSLKMDDIKADQCIEDNKDVDVNLFAVDTAFRRSVLLDAPGTVIEKVNYSQTATGEIACNMLTPWGGSGSYLDGAWAEYFEEHITSGSGLTKTCTLNSKWAREKIDLPCGSPAPGPEWIVIVDGCPAGNTTWARPARLYGCKFTQPDFGDTTQTSLYECQIVGDAPENISIDNGLPLERVFTIFLNNFCPGIVVVSNFFQINPDVVSAINYVTGLRSKTRYITIFQKSDVKRPTASGNATIANMNFGDLLSDLVNMFNVRWRFEGDVLRIEHVSFFSKTQGFDLTLPKWIKWVNGKRKYTYDTSSIPQKEVFKFMEAGPGDFAGAPITYSDCVTKTGRDVTKTYAVDKVTTDVQLCLSNPDPDSSVVQDDGFVFMAADTLDSITYYAISESSILGGNVINNSLAWAQLHRDYHKWARAERKGQMNYLDTTFISVIPTKRGTPITIPLCCGDDFNPDNTILTPLGLGVVDKANFSFKNETLELELLYVADDNLVTNAAPHAGDDVATTTINTSVLIDVLSNDTDEKNQLLTLKVILPPLHGTAVVEGKKIRYTPAAGYTGSDLFIYNVSDEWNQPSNNAVVSIVVTAANAAPIARPDNYDTNKNTLLSVGAFLGLFTNDSDDVGFSLDAFDATSVHGGTVHVNTDGSFTFNPATGYVGVDTFTYRIIDAGSLTSTATVTITVRDPNAPVANQDVYQTVRNTNLTVAAPGVLANDTTAIGSLTATAGTIATTAGGSVTMAANGSFTYIPPAGFTGNDTFNYTADNGTSTDVGLVTIRVLPLIYVKLQLVNLTSTNNVLTGCPGGVTDGGVTKTETVRVLFYSNSAGTVPFDITPYNLLVNLRIASQSTIGGPVTNLDSPYSVNGTQTDIFTNRTYFRQIKNCAGATTVYTNESFSLLAGAYTII